MAQRPGQPPLTRAEYKRLARIRLRESRKLLIAREFSGAYYLAGFGVECAIKAVIARQVKPNTYPENNSNKYYVHDPTALVGLASLDPAAEAQKDPYFGQNWATVKDWRVDSRYEIIGRRLAIDLYRAIVARKHGVLQWLRQNW